MAFICSRTESYEIVIIIMCCREVEETAAEGEEELEEGQKEVDVVAVEEGAEGESSSSEAAQAK